MDNPNFFAILPAKVRYAKINPSAKIIFAEITALANKSGYCTATNKYFSNVFNTTTVNVSRWFNILSNEGFIKVEMIKKNNQIVERRVYPVMDAMGNPSAVDFSIETFDYKGLINKNVNTGINKNVNTGINKNVKENNTSKNNIYREENENQKLDKQTPEEAYQNATTHIRKADALKEFLFNTTHGGFVLNGIKENRKIKIKAFDDERIINEVYNFFAHHQLNAYLISLAPNSSQIKAEFEKWLMRDLCKPQEGRKGVENKKATKFIKNELHHSTKIGTMIPSEYSESMKERVIKILGDLVNIPKFEKALEKDTQGAWRVLKQKLINAISNNIICYYDAYKILTT